MHYKVSHARFSIIAFLFIQLLFSWNNTYGQEEEVFSVETGLGFIDLLAPQHPFIKQLTKADWDGIYQGVPLYIGVSKKINPSFSGIVHFQTAQVDTLKYNSQPFTNDLSKKINHPTIWNVYAGLRYNIANGYLLSKESWFNMFFEGGFGNTFINNRPYLSQYTGVGFDFNSTGMGLFAHGGYNYMWDWEDYFSFELGIKIQIKSHKKSQKLTEKNTPPAETVKNEDYEVGREYPLNNNEIYFEPYLNNSVGSFNTTSENPSEAIKPVSSSDPVTSGSEPGPGTVSQGSSNQRPVNRGNPIQKIDILEKPKPFQKVQSPKSVPLQRRSTPTSNQYYFDTDSYQIPDGYLDELKEIASQLKEIEDLYVKIYGHTDNQYERSYNLTLSENRAFALKKALMEMGVEERKIRLVKGYGEDRPIFPNTTEENRMKNRRVEVELFTL